MTSHIIAIHDRSLRRYERARPRLEFLHDSELLGVTVCEQFQFATSYENENEAWSALQSFVAADPDARGEVWRIDRLIVA